MIFLLLPAFNEEPEILPLFAEADKTAACLEEPLQIVLVDDGSTDLTAGTAENADTKIPVQVIRHPRNSGLGRALLTGFQAIAQKTGSSSDAADEDVIITMDTDNTHSPSYIPEMVKKLRENNLALVVASRYAPGGEEIGVPAHRKLLSSAASIFYRWFYRTPGLSDYTCGYRAYRVGAVRKVMERFGPDFIEETGFPSTGEILLKIRAVSPGLGEVPFSLHYEKKHTPSKMPKIRTILATLQILWKYRNLA